MEVAGVLSSELSREVERRPCSDGNWTTRGLADSAKRTKTKHGESPVASASCLVRELTSPRDVQSANPPVRELTIRELAYPRVVQ